MAEANPGILYIVATPIGNLDDITLRALKILKDVDYIAAEDTRHSQKLLNHFGIKKPLLSLHDFNEKRRSEELVARLEAGDDIALISDAGTPLISDPGFSLVKKVSAVGITVVPIPGACALIAAIQVAGLPTDKFVFEGFLPPKVNARCTRLMELKGEMRTLIFYVSPHRLLKELDDFIRVFGVEREVVLAKELTKAFETIYGGTFQSIKNWLLEDLNHQKGEFVILVHGASVDKKSVTSQAEEMLHLLVKEVSAKRAVEITAKITGVRKNLLKSLIV